MTKLGFNLAALVVCATIGTLATTAWTAPIATTSPAAAGALLTKQEANEIDGVIASMIAAGFPDTSGASVYCGKLVVSATFDPTKTAPPLPTSASQTQMTQPNSSKVTYGFEFQGLHFKLRDGSWIIALSYRFKPGPDDKVNTTDARQITLANIIPDALAAHPFDAEQKAGAWLERVEPAERARDATVMNRLVPVTMYLMLSPDGIAPAVVLLQRAGWADAGELSLAIAQQRARNYWQLKPWTTPDMPFDPSGAYPQSKAEEAAWAAAHPHFASEPPEVALRRALFRWCRAQMLAPEPEDAMLPLDVAAATARAAVDPKDPQGNLPRLDALLAGARLPVVPAENADLPTRHARR